MENLTILFADDDMDYSMLLKCFLEQEGFKVIYVQNGKDAVEAFRQKHPDLVLLDINMPELDGFEVARLIRAKDKNVLIFFLSDRTEKTDRLKGFGLKGNDYIAKPFYPEELIARIHERLDNRTDHTEVYKLGNTLFTPSSNEVAIGNDRQVISTRQSEILAILARNLNQVVERQEILNIVWGNDSYANSLALNVQITYIRHILSKDSIMTIDSIKGKGYIMKVLYR